MVPRTCAFLIGVPLVGCGLGLVQLQLGGEAKFAELREGLRAEVRRHAEAREMSSTDVKRRLQFIDGSVAWLEENLPVAMGAALVPGVFLFGVALWPRGKPKPSRREADRGSTDAGGEAPPLSRRELRKALKAAAALAQEHGPERAGDFLLGSGLRDQALNWFTKAKLWERAAEIRHDQNRFEESAELYEKAERPESAGAIYARLERFEDAARCYLAADKRSVAGEMFERSGSHDQAARCYRDIGFFRHAAQAFLRAGEELEAARCLVQTFNDEGGERALASPQKARELRAVAAKAGELFAKHSKLEDAETILVRAGNFTAGAQVAMKAGAYDRAAQLFQKLGRGDLAADALERAGDRAGAARARGEYLAEKGDDAAAIQHLQEAGEHQQSGDLLRKLERYAEAGECYEACSDHAAAAEMFKAASQPDRASVAFENAGDLAQAAEQAALAGDLDRYADLLEKAGDLFEAGCAFAEQGKSDQAIRLLQRIEASEPKFREACALLGRLFMAKGMHSLSINKLEQAVGDGSVGRSTVDAYYDLGQALERRGAHAHATEIYEKILAFDYHHRDVAERLDRVKAEARASDGSDQGRSTNPPLAPASGRYVVTRELGRGGMGVVYLAKDTVLERQVAYKVLPEGLRGNPTALSKFLREAKAAAQLNHPHIVTVYDAGESEHGFYLAMEYVDGTTLKELLQRRGKISPGGVLYVLRQMADALAYAHSKKVVHRDIKTANTMWTTEKQVKIMDFGLAKLMEEVRNATTLVSGTPFYMSPEQTLGRNVDHRTDLYSLGVTLFELCTGQLPFRKGNVPYHHVHTPPPDPRELDAEIPEPLAKLILKCLEKEPDNRFSNATEILEELDRLGAKA